MASNVFEEHFGGEKHRQGKKAAAAAAMAAAGRSTGLICVHT
jgi:hypothetical protein